MRSRAVLTVGVGQAQPLTRARHRAGSDRPHPLPYRTTQTTTPASTSRMIAGAQKTTSDSSLLRSGSASSGPNPVSSTAGAGAAGCLDRPDAREPRPERPRSGTIVVAGSSGSPRLLHGGGTGAAGGAGGLATGGFSAGGLATGGLADGGTGGPGQASASGGSASAAAAGGR